MKKTVRKKKKEIVEYDNCPHNTIATFDLQQIIYLSKTNDNILRYKKRLANYNLTIYELKTKAYHFLVGMRDKERGDPRKLAPVRVFILISRMRLVSIHSLLMGVLIRTKIL